MAESKQEMDNIFSFKAATKVKVATTPRNRGKHVLKTVATKVYGMETRCLLDPGAVLNILSKEVAERLGVGQLKTSHRIKEISGVESPVLGVLKEVPVQLEERVVRMNFLVVNGYPHEVIIWIPTREALWVRAIFLQPLGFIHLGRRTLLFSDGSEVCPRGFRPQVRHG